MANSVLSDPEYLKCVHSKEKSYFGFSVLFSLVLWLLMILGTMGIGLIYLAFFALSITVGHAIFIAYIRGYGIEVSEGQFSDIYTIVKNTSEKLGLKNIPSIYIYNMDGIFNAFATHFFSRNFIIITTSVLDACDNDLKKIEFIVAHEMVHLQRGHTRRQFFLFPSRVIPWLGNAYSRACEYTCDGIAGKFILDNQEQAIRGILLLPTANAKRSQDIDIGAYETQRSKGGGFWMTLVQTGSTHPFTFNRVASVRSLFGEKIEHVSQSFFGMLLSPFFSLGGGSGAQVLVVVAIVGIIAAALFPAMSAYLERGRQMQMRQLEIQQQINSFDSEGE